MNARGRGEGILGLRRCHLTAECHGPEMSMTGIETEDCVRDHRYIDQEESVSVRLAHLVCVGVLEISKFVLAHGRGLALGMK